MRTPGEIRLEIERLSARRAELLHQLGLKHDPKLVQEHAKVEEEIARLWEEHRIARAHVRFGEREAIIARARAEERLDRAAA